MKQMMGMQIPQSKNRVQVAAGRLQKAPGTRQQGFSMVEMMVSAALGLVVTAAVVHSVASSHAGSRTQEVQARMYDMGQMALNQMADQIRMAGYWAPPSEVLSADSPANGDPGINGCTGSFVDPAAPWGSLSCATSGASSAPHALAVRFEPVEGGRNWDCAGNAIIHPDLNAKRPTGKSADPNVVSPYVESRFYVAAGGRTFTKNPALMCRTMTGLPNEQTQLIADNVEHFQVDYGVSPINSTQATRNAIFDEPALSGRTARYLKAHQLNSNCTPGNVMPDSWCAVTSVRICIVMRSDDNVNTESNTPFINCDGVLDKTKNDRRFRQAFTMTVALRNRTAVDNCSGNGTVSSGSAGSGGTGTTPAPLPKGCSAPATNTAGTP
ncbi:MAG: PilW family protein [Lautropia sp.]|nr:PilW family protein [Lautropia sp.]